MPDTPAGYVTVEQIVAATGVRPDDFKLDGDEQLKELLVRWGGYVKSLIDENYSPPRDFLKEADDVLDDVPGSVRSVAERAMARWVNIVRSHRDSALIRLDDWRVGIDLVDDVLPANLRRDLPRRRRRFGGFASHGGSS